MMQPTLVCLLSVLCWAAASSPPPTTACVESTNSSRTPSKGWPVLAAFKVMPMTGATLKVTLSHKQHTHTNITFTYRNKEDEALLVELMLESSVTKTNTSLVVLLTPNSWSTLKLNLHKNKLLVVVTGTNTALHYTTRVQLDVLHHIGVHSVSSTCAPLHLAEVDLACLYDQGEDSIRADKSHTQAENTTHVQGTPAWPFFLVFLLLLVVCILFLAWRYQHNQIKLKRRFQEETEAAMKRAGERQPQRSSRGASQDDKEDSQDTNEDSEGHRVSDRVQYSTILMSYDGPCTTDDEERSQIYTNIPRTSNTGGVLKAASAWS
ncbi:hypothetical protein OTU49_006651 [Cherax quadricarinatus]|uniref:Uncharacterized protein n=2 Tax=Cherax quadricarinatus TaxID=27406 RepID=A0AAW0WL37_CHEQU